MVRSFPFSSVLVRVCVGGGGGVRDRLNAASFYRKVLLAVQLFLFQKDLVKEIYCETTKRCVCVFKKNYFSRLLIYNYRICLHFVTISGQRGLAVQTFLQSNALLAGESFDLKLQTIAFEFRVKQSLSWKDSSTFKIIRNKK